MQDYREDIERAFDGMNRWNIFYSVFIFPIGVGFFLFAGYIVPGLGKAAVQSNRLFQNNLIDIEYLLGFSGNMLGLFFICCWIFYFCILYISKRNRIKAYLYYQIMFATISFVSLYSIFYGFQFFVPFLLIRMLNWLLLIGSVLVAIYKFMKNEKIPTFQFFQSQSKAITNIFLLIWGISAIFKVFSTGYDQLLAKILISVIPLAPPMLALFISSILLAQLQFLQKFVRIVKNQEHYRKEFGYSIEDWYGKKSKQYKKWLKENI
ncbi:TPA: hypothetical protein U1C94_002356 [Streptococcus suis]|nr:hypothetical protein [Streptococcus suis]